MSGHRKVVYWCVFVGGLFLAAEIIAALVGRYLLAPVDRMRVDERVRHRAEVAAFIDSGRFDPVLGWTEEPGTTRWFDGWSCSFDADSSRMNRLHRDRVAAAAYGDSFTFGDEVNDDQTWPYFLSSMMKANVKNFGAGGYGTDQAFLRFRGSVRADTPGIVMLGILSENLARNLNRFRMLYVESWRPPKPMYRGTAGAGFELLPNPAHNEDGLYRLLDQDAIQEACAPYDYFYPFYAARPMVRFPYTLALLRAVVAGRAGRAPDYKEICTDERAIAVTVHIAGLFAAEVRERGSRPVIILMPTVWDVRDARAGRPVCCEAFVARLSLLDDLTVIDLLPALCIAIEDSALTEADIYPAQAHLSPAGNQLVASIIFEALFN